MNCTTLRRIHPESVELIQNVSETVPDLHRTWTPVLADNIANPFEKSLKHMEKALEIKADLVILCTGSQPEDSLYESCVRNRLAPEIHSLGDAFSAGRVLEAVKAGYALGISI